MTLVYSISQKKLIESPDTGTTEMVSQPVAQTTGTTLPKIEPITNITGHSLQEHAQALNKAKAAGDNMAIKSIQDDYDREYKYQQDYGGLSNVESKKQAATLRKEFMTQADTQGFQTIKAAWEKMQGAGQTGGGDISIMYSYIKMLDPNSVVREGELALGDRAAGLPDRVVKAYNKAVKTKGQGLAPVQRTQYVDEARNIYNSVAKKQKEVNAFYTGLAIDMGVDPNDVIGTVGNINLAEEPVKVKKPYQLPIIGPMINQLKGFAQDVGSGLAVKSKDYQVMNESVQNAQKGVDQLVARAKIEADPIKKQKLLDLAREQSAKLGDISAGGQPQFSEDVNEPYWKRGLETGINIAAFAELPSIVKGGVNLVKGIGGKTPGVGSNLVKTVEKAKQYTPKSLFGKREAEEAVKTVGKVKPEVDKIIKVGKKLAETDPDIEKLVGQYAPKIENIKDIPTLLERMKVWGKAYGRGGTVKASAKAVLYDAYYKEALSQLKSLAPEVYKNRQYIRYSYELPKIAGKALWRATLGRVLTGGL